MAATAKAAGIAGKRSSAPGEASKLAAQTARRIEDGIIAAGWPVGDVFGSEAELIRRYNVSRAVLREAIRLVEHHGVARMRRGPAGGLVVRAPDLTAAISAVVLYLENLHTSVADLLSARRILEPLAASLAAQNITEADIQRLRSILETDRSLPAVQTLSTSHNAFHIEVAALSGNETLALFLRLLAGLTARYATTRSRIARTDSMRGANEVAKAHEAIATAIIAGDAATAQHRADAHLAAVQRFLTARRRPAGERGSPRRTAAGVKGDDGGAKLAEVIAERIRGDIVSAGYAVGDVVGSEASLLETYGVSRAVLREAVRLLEHHSIARMRRGPGGGLVVTAPDPGASIGAIALYLEYRGAGAEELRVVRDAIELGVVDLVAGKAADPGLARRVRAALLVDLSTDLSAISEQAHHLHTALADISGNPVLALLLRIAISLWRRHTGNIAGPRPLPAPEIVPTVVKAHDAIVDAVLAGDHGLARHRMRRHLAALADWWE